MLCPPLKAPGAIHLHFTHHQHSEHTHTRTHRMWIWSLAVSSSKLNADPPVTTCPQPPSPPLKTTHASSNFAQNQTNVLAPPNTVGLGLSQDNYCWSDYGGELLWPSSRGKDYRGQIFVKSFPDWFLKFPRRCQTDMWTVPRPEGDAPNNVGS